MDFRREGGEIEKSAALFLSPEREVWQHSGRVILYKYLRPERIDVLEELQIRFSPAISMNDAFELKPLTKGWASKEVTEMLLAERLSDFLNKADSPEKMLRMAVAHHPEAEASFRNTMKILGASKWFQLMKDGMGRNIGPAVTAMQSYIDENWDKIFQNISKILGTQLGILSLSEDPRNPVMWGNYADSSRGLVIGFDGDHRWFNQKRSPEDEFCHLRKVTYVPSSPRYMSELTGQDVAYSKLEAWSYEKEWRILFPLLNGIDTKLLDSFGQPIIVFPVPPGCITEVIVGSRAARDLYQKVLGTCTGRLSHVTVSKGTT